MGSIILALLIALGAGVATGIGSFLAFSAQKILIIHARAFSGRDDLCFSD
jgi:hypothetical protein